MRTLQPLLKEPLSDKTSCLSCLKKMISVTDGNNTKCIIPTRIIPSYGAVNPCDITS